MVADVAGGRALQRHPRWLRLDHRRLCVDRGVCLAVRWRYRRFYSHPQLARAAEQAQGRRPGRCCRSPRLLRPVGPPRRGL
eukprot:6184324-Pleurochrysis_carterae.AAC.2